MRTPLVLLLLVGVAAPACAGSFGEADRKAYCRYQSEVDRIVQESWEVFGGGDSAYELQPSDTVVVQEVVPLVPILDVTGYTFEELAVEWRNVVDLTPGVEVVVRARRDRAGGTMMYEVDVPELDAHGFIHPDAFSWLDDEDARRTQEEEALAWRTARYKKLRAALLPGVDFGALQEHALKKNWRNSCG